MLTLWYLRRARRDFLGVLDESPFFIYEIRNV